MFAVKRSIVLPLYDNDGATLRVVHQELQDALARIAGGYSATSQTGTWRNENGRTFSEPSQLYTVVCTPEQDIEIVKLLPSFTIQARQEALLTYASTIDATFIDGGVSNNG